MRRNTADEWLINRVRELKAEGIDEFICLTFNGEKWLKPVYIKTAQGISAYANRMYDKYGDKFQVNVEYLVTDPLDIKVLTTYAA